MHVGIAYPRWRGKRSRHYRRMRTRNFTYLSRGPCAQNWHRFPRGRSSTAIPSTFDNLYQSLISEDWIRNPSTEYDAKVSTNTGNSHDLRCEHIKVSISLLRVQICVYNGVLCPVRQQLMDWKHSIAGYLELKKIKIAIGIRLIVLTTQSSKL